MPRSATASGSTNASTGGPSRSLESYMRTYVIDYQWPGFGGATHEATQGLPRPGESEAQCSAARVPEMVRNFVDELGQDDSVTGYGGTNDDLDSVHDAAEKLANKADYSAITLLGTRHEAAMPGGDPLLRVMVNYQEE